MQIKGMFLRKKKKMTLCFSYGDTPSAWLALCKQTDWLSAERWRECLELWPTSVLGCGSYFGHFLPLVNWSLIVACVETWKPMEGQPGCGASISQLPFLPKINLKSNFQLKFSWVLPIYVTLWNRSIFSFFFFFISQFPNSVPKAAGVFSCWWEQL